VSLTGGSATMWNPGMSLGPGMGTLTANSSVSPGYVPVLASVFIQPPGAHVAAPIWKNTKVIGNSQSFSTPDIPSATFDACALQAETTPDGGSTGAFGAACATGLGKDATPTLVLPPGTTFTAPPSTAGIGTQFVYSPLASGVYLVAFTPVSGTTSAGDTIYVVTSDAQARIPDLTGIGFNLPHGATYVAVAFGFAPFGNIDAATGPSGFAEYAVDFRLDQGPLVDGQLARSQDAPFVVQ